MKRQMMNLLGIGCLAAAYTVGATDLVSVSSAGGTRNYETIQEALGTCTGGETLTLLDNASVGGSLKINAPVTIDLDGHALGCSANDVNFLWVENGAPGFTVKNGSLSVTGESANIVPAAGSSVVASNVTFTGFGVCWSGTGGNVTLNDCLVKTDYAASSDSTGVTMTLEGDTVLAPTTGFYNRGIQGTTLEFRSARSSRHPRDICAPFNAAFIYDPATVRGVDCKFRILSAEAAAAYLPVYVISADGVTSNGYVTIDAAIIASQSGQTISLIKDCTVSQMLKFNSSVNVEMNGCNLHNTAGDFLQPAADVTVNINGGGGAISIAGLGSVFSVANGGCFNVTNCAVYGYCVVHGNAPGIVNFYDAVNVRIQGDKCFLASGGGSATLNVFGGTYQFKEWRDSYNNSGTTIRFYGGYIDANHNPYSKTYTPLQVLGDGCRVFYSDRFSGFPHEVVPPEVWEGWTIEASNAGVYYTSLDTALKAGWNGSTVELLGDLSRVVTVPTTNTRRSFTLDMQGHEIFFAKQYTNPFATIGSLIDLTLTNGTVKVGGDTACCFGLASPNVSLTAVAGAQLIGTVTPTGGFYINADNVQVVLDGALLQTTYLVSWGGGTHSSITFRGDGTNIVSGFMFPGGSIPEGSAISVCGGWWNINPSAYVPDNHVKLYHSGKTPCAYRVKSWADICAKGWTFDPAADGVPVATGVCDAVPDEPIVVSLVDGLPRRKTSLVDLRALQFTAGTLTVDSFACDPTWPRSGRIELEDGILKVWDSIGTAVIIR